MNSEAELMKYNAIQSVFNAGFEALDLPCLFLTKKCADEMRVTNNKLQVLVFSQQKNEKPEHSWYIRQALIQFNIFYVLFQFQSFGNG